MSQKDKPLYSRRVRIECAKDDIDGMHVSILDADTGEAISNIACAIIYLKPGEVNEVCLTYYVKDEQGKICVREPKEGEAFGDLMMGKVEIADPEIAITAYEREDKAEWIRRKR